MYIVLIQRKILCMFVIKTLRSFNLENVCLKIGIGQQRSIRFEVSFLERFVIVKILLLLVRLLGSSDLICRFVFKILNGQWLQDRYLFCMMEKFVYEEELLLKNMKKEKPELLQVFLIFLLFSFRIFLSFFLSFFCIKVVFISFNKNWEIREDNNPYDQQTKVFLNNRNGPKEESCVYE